MSAERPDYVRLAEALGWTSLRQEPVTSNWLGIPPEPLAAVEDYVPRYDLPGYDLLPLVEANRICLETNFICRRIAYQSDEGYIRSGDDGRAAIIACLLALAEAGKLVRA